MGRIFIPPVNSNSPHGPPNMELPTSAPPPFPLPPTPVSSVETDRKDLQVSRTVSPTLQHSQSTSVKSEVKSELVTSPAPSSIKNPPMSRPEATPVASKDMYTSEPSISTSAAPTPLQASGVCVCVCVCVRVCMRVYMSACVWFVCEILTPFASSVPSVKAAPSVKNEPVGSIPPPPSRPETPIAMDTEAPDSQPPTRTPQQQQKIQPDPALRKGVAERHCSSLGTKSSCVYMYLECCVVLSSDLVFIVCV